MTSLAERLARPEVLALEPFDIAANNALANPNAIRLDANENPFPPLVEGPLAASVNRYPEPQPSKLKAALAALYGVQPANLVITRGADDAIDILIRSYCRPGTDAVAICTPSFSAYAHFVRLQGARLVEAKLTNGFDFDADAFLAAVGEEQNLRLAFICTPNNPTGNEVDPAAILKIADALPNTIIVADEAYLDFSTTPSLATEATRRPNLVVLKTLSKAFGLAGARVGCAIGEPGLIEIAARALPPYPMPSLSVDAAMAALSPSRRSVHEERIERLKADRDRLAEALQSSPIVRRVHGSGGNFLFLEVDDAPALAARLRALGIRVRFRPNAAPGGVRITIGADAENDALLSAFGVNLEASASRRAEVVRDTKETEIAVAVDLDRAAPRKIDTGVPFYDHMLDQVAAHGGFSLVLDCDGDTEIDAHHSIEDCAIALGTALSQALGDKRGIRRFGFTLPMDEAEAQVLIDLSGRPYCRFEGEFAQPSIGDYPTQMTRHVFRSLADSMGAAIHVKVDGENDHHKTEACFKAFGRALRDAIRREGDALPSTKGVL
ncbi:histidinol-phosphate transaminase [Sphingomonas sp. SM33]|uniref:Multifunctional fusion protein n=1 Tax=Sphingomonas telluris TaxID=2907998 RepID=A0ABS9VMB8_9SPHN|nr:histidinol-phosphate transaminase [Sphingomonas telluris]MCH8616105.1 histidinol-phosphate transaminase [Sphingomonas telluris]